MNQLTLHLLSKRFWLLKSAVKTMQIPLAGAGPKKVNQSRGPCAGSIAFLLKDDRGTANDSAHVSGARYA